MAKFFRAIVRHTNHANNMSPQITFLGHKTGIHVYQIYDKLFCIFSVVPLLFRSMYSPIQETWIGQTSRKWELLN